MRLSDPANQARCASSILHDSGKGPVKIEPKKTYALGVWDSEGEEPRLVSWDDGKKISDTASIASVDEKEPSKAQTKEQPKGQKKGKGQKKK
mmetsp:Transcript_21759/g.29579  ORF Transcript_21759/g.29579 Transcript_21759/m.29579 type:complete len:92 (+) Transcript_21759:395-670(+)